MSQVCVLWHATEVKGLFIRSMQHEHGDKKVEEGEKRPKIAKWYLLFRSLPVVASMLQPEHELEVVIFLSVLCPGIASSHSNTGSDTNFTRRCTNTGTLENTKVQKQHNSYTI